MQRLWRLSVVIAVLLCLCEQRAFSEQPESIPIVGSGELVDLSVLPEEVVIRGRDELHQLVLTGHFANGGVKDLTTKATWRVADDAIARVEDAGLLVSVGSGKTEVLTEFAGKSVPVAVTVIDGDQPLPINFAHEIVPIFSKLGCNAGACHGKASGQNGFKLSLLGFDPQIDYEALTRQARGRRLFPAAPASSLLLQKATGAVGHGGGGRLEPASRQYRLLSRWIRSGAPFGDDGDPQVVRIGVTPEQRLVAPESAQQLAVTAHFSDGSQRDVTTRAEYSSNDTEIVTVSETGLVQTHGRPGEGAVMIRFLGHLAVFRATIPQQVPAEAFADQAAANFIDELVFGKLRQLGIPPSSLCSDGEFLRRASIDITGTLPSAEEVEQFLSDNDPNKRQKLVDRLLERPAYASYFALKWGDILRNRRKGLVRRRRQRTHRGAARLDSTKHCRKQTVRPVRARDHHGPRRRVRRRRSSGGRLV
jgi:hypothetical protein